MQAIAAQAAAIAVLGVFNTGAFGMGCALCYSGHFDGGSS
jgi:hypothetical protein